jgi:2-(1,2-epoxy-1,2-dihydrophenyl)acetyl-CoA isomerase
MSASPARSDVSVTLDEDLVGIVEIHRPPDNYFDAELVGRLADACDALAAGGSCRAILLCSEGRHFCAGVNFGRPRTARERSGPHLYEVGMRLFEQPLPMVAAVQGAAIGGGLGLALAADFRVAAPEARFAANFSVLGFHQGFGISVTLPAVTGRQAALDLLYTGRRINGQEALRIGLCDRLVGVDDLRHEAHTFAAGLAASAPLAVRSIRETMRRDLVRDIRAVLGRERSEQERLMKTADWREGIAAARARRRPAFTGR